MLLAMPRLTPLLLATCLATLPALGTPRTAEHEMVRKAVEAGSLQPLASLLQRLEQRYGGRVVDVELERDSKGRRLYEVKLLDQDGRRRQIYVDATTGAEVTEPAGQAMAMKPFAEVVRGLLATHPGRVIDVELELGVGGVPVYEVRILQADGRLRELLVDARTGQLREADLKRLAPLESLKPLPDILEIVLAKFAGSIREIELEHDHKGRRYYEIDMRMPDGRLLEINVDAVTGAIFQADAAD